MKPITQWNRWNPDTQSFLFNHIEEGHSDREKPYAKFPSQKGWEGSEWTKAHVYLDAENRIVRA